MSKVTQQRKDDHITINLNQNVQFPHLRTGLEQYRFVHRALPELDLSEIDTSLTLFGKPLNSPIFISSMTGGTERAKALNLTLAQAAQTYGLAMGVGSQRAAIENKALVDTFQVRQVAPDILLFANLGAVQLNYSYGVEQCLQAVEMIQADALILHFNAIQEAVQPEGDTRFGKLAEKVAVVCASLPIPVIAKEVGWGFSSADVTLLAQAGVKAIDVAGSGGTSWSEVEYHRAPSSFHAQVARSFADWGIPTAEAIQYAKQAAPQLPVLASGGLRDGLDIAKAIALGAQMGGLASPFLKAADQSYEALCELIEITQRQLEIAMFCTQSATLAQLGQAPLVKL